MDKKDDYSAIREIYEMEYLEREKKTTQKYLKEQKRFELVYYQNTIEKKAYFEILRDALKYSYEHHQNGTAYCLEIIDTKTKKTYPHQYLFEYWCKQ